MSFNVVLTFEEFNNKLLDKKNQWKYPYKYIVLRRLLLRYPEPQSKSDIINSNSKLKEAKELNNQNYWTDILKEKYCNDLKNDDIIELNIEDITSHQRDHLLEI